MKFSGGLLAAVGSGVIACPAVALDIVIDYSNDTGFLSNNAAAVAALEAAASDLEAIISTTLPEVVDFVGETFDSDSSTSNVGLAEFNFSNNYTNPSTGSSVTLNNAAIAEDQIRVFVGARPIAGSAIGQGGPGGWGYGVSAGSSGSGFSFDEFDLNANTAWSLAYPQAEANIRRAGPVLGNFTQTINSSSGGPWQIDFDTGISLGNVWFDTATNWHYDHTTPVEFSSLDFYSTALHELVHVLGLGTSDSWDDLANGDDWMGPEVIALLGSGNNILEADENHIAAGTLSTSLIDGGSQEAAMDPTLTNGQRKFLTELDVAFLDDIGWDIVLPNPGLAGDFDNDGDVDADDIDLLYSNLGDPAFDLTDDGNADSADLDELILNILGTAYGDADLDQTVGTPDLAILAGSFGSSTGWAGGNFDGVGVVSTPDLAILAGSFGFDDTGSVQAATAAVPEPAGVACLAAGALALLRRRVGGVDG